MAGEARKAAERLMAEIREKAMVLDLANEWQINEAKAVEVIEQALAETREQCAQIAESEKVDYEATKSPDDLAYNSAIEHVAAAIRSIAQQDSANEGEDK